MKKYFISFVLQEPNNQDVFGDCCIDVSGKLNFFELKDTLKKEVEFKFSKTKKLIILNIVKL